MTEEKVSHVIGGLDAWNSGDFEKLLEKTDGNYSELVKAHTPMVLDIARGYYHKYHGAVTFPNLVMEGIAILYDSIKKFDPSRGVKFSSYAYKGLRRGMERRILEDIQTIWVPFGRVEDMNQLEGESLDFYKAHGRYPTYDELRDSKNVRVHKISDESIRMFMEKAIRPAISLDQPPDGFDEDNQMYDFYASEPLETPLDRLEKGEHEKKLIAMADRAGLDARERYILFSLTGVCGHEEKNMSEMGMDLHLTRERVRQLKNIAFEKVRKASGIIPHGGAEDEE